MSTCRACYSTVVDKLVVDVVCSLLTVGT